MLNDGKKLDRFVEDFACSHRHVNCDKARCRNVHEKNHNIARRILTERGDLAQHLFNSENFTLENCIKMKHVFDTTISITSLHHFTTFLPFTIYIP